jgi:hypothetical protein
VFTFLPPVNGYKIESTPISIDEREFSKLLRENGANTVFAIEFTDNNSICVKRRVKVSTCESRNSVFTFLPPISMAKTGESVGVKAGGVLTQTLYTATVSATPEKLPEGIDVDISVSASVSSDKFTDNNSICVKRRVKVSTCESRNSKRFTQPLFLQHQKNYQKALM